MLSLKQTNCLTVVGMVFAVVCFCESASLAAGRIDDVKITPDLKRVIVKCGGPVDEKMSSSVQRSSLLVIDLPGAVLGDVERSTRTGREAGLEVRVSKTHSGARLVLDFGGAAAPEHKIRRVGDYLMVFLGEWTPKAVPPKKTLAAPTVRPAPPAQAARPKPNPPAKLALNSSSLTIKSVEVIDGVIVLQVANLTKPAGNYRVELGINFDQPGFSVANIQPIEEFRKPTALSRNVDQLWSRAAVSGIRTGPRKTAVAYLMKRTNEMNIEALGKIGKDKNQAPNASGLSRLRKNHRSPFAASRPSHDARIQKTIFPARAAVTFHQARDHERTTSIFSQASKFSFDPSELH
jgi:hypothetical protein